ncbi:hypothetical protein, partial [Candidatus Clavichlamydia salmonicola]|uniref:hypothetical protein n=1 Tax=Candidatus Clavichlamydia salmonicola TaxID=469812 RepID=UPI001E289650
ILFYMPYFTLDYFLMNSPNKTKYFMVKESKDLFTPQHLQELTMLTQEILSNKLLCFSVPSSFPLALDMHTNALNILSDVTLPLVIACKNSLTDPKDVDIANNLQTDLLNSILTEDLSLFNQPLPTVRNDHSSSLQRTTSPLANECPYSAFSPSLSPSFLDDSTAFSPSLSPSFLDDSTAFSLPIIEISPDDFDPNQSSNVVEPASNLSSVYYPPYKLWYSRFDLSYSISTSNFPIFTETTSSVSDSSNYLLPTIEVSSEYNRYILVEKPVKSLMNYFLHLHAAIDFVLTHFIYQLTDEFLNSVSYTQFAWHQQSLSFLLKLMRQQSSLLVLIDDPERSAAITTAHKNLVVDLVLSLEKGSLKNNEPKASPFQRISSSI